jgi:hypothetical protein
MDSDVVNRLYNPLNTVHNLAHLFKNIDRKTSKCPEKLLINPIPKKKPAWQPAFG